MRTSTLVARVVAAAATAALALAGLTSTAANASTPTTPCNLNPSGSKSDNNEVRSCLRVTATLSQAIAVGQRARLDIAVDAAVDRPAVDIVAELPPTLRWVTRPVGMAAGTRLSKAPHGAGQLQLARVRRAIGKGQRLRYSGTVEAVAAGTAELNVSATAAAGDPTQTGADSVFLTIGSTAGASHFGIRVDRKARTATYRGTAARPIVAEKAHKSLGRPPQRPAVRVASPGGTACVTGTWNYLDKDGIGRVGISWTVEVWDADATGDSLLASQWTGFSGEYNLCFDNGDPDGSGRDIRIRFLAQNNNWRVQTASGFVYNYTTGTVDDVADGSTTDFGWLRPGPAEDQRVGAAFAAVQVVWNNTPGSCWDMNGPCRPVVVQWASDSTDGTYYRPSDDHVHLAAADPDAAITVAHETSHSIMDDVFDDDFPSAPNCNPHSIPGSFSAGCAWVEGFAEWLPATVFNDPNFRWPNGAVLNLEDPTWGSPGWSDGDTVEGRVAGAMIDLTDGNNEGSDRVGEGISSIWTTFQNHNSKTFAEFWSDRGSDGFDVGNDALGSLYQNTIDYGFAG